MAAGVRTRSVDGLRPGEQLKMIRTRVEELVRRQDAIFLEQIVPALADAGVRFSDWSSLDDDDRVHLVDVFQRQIFPVLTPLAVDPGHPFPYISNLSLNLVVQVQDPSTGERRIARVKVPPVLPRFVVMPDGERFVPLEQVIAAHLDTLFPGMSVGEHYAVPRARATQTWRSRKMRRTISWWRSRWSCAAAASGGRCGSRSAPT